MTHHTGSDEGRLREVEREALVAPCSCGHTINDHGSLIACWVCADDLDEPRECGTDFETLLAERVAGIVTARAAAPDALRERLLAWIDDQRQLLPEHRTPVAHAKAELLRDLRAALADPTDGATT